MKDYVPRVGYKGDKFHVRDEICVDLHASRRARFRNSLKSSAQSTDLLCLSFEFVSAVVRATRLSY